MLLGATTTLHVGSHRCRPNFCRLTLKVFLYDYNNSTSLFTFRLYTVPIKRSKRSGSSSIRWIWRAHAALAPGSRWTASAARKNDSIMEFENIFWFSLDLQRERERERERELDVQNSLELKTVTNLNVLFDIVALLFHGVFRNGHPRMIERLANCNPFGRRYVEQFG